MNYVIICKEKHIRLAEDINGNRGALSRKLFVKLGFDLMSKDSIIMIKVIQTSPELNNRIE